jgi:fibronectin type 3 domain-containing protein
MTLAAAMVATETVHAQQKDTPVAATPDGKGVILVIWAAPNNVLPSDGFTVRRTANGQTTTLAQNKRPGDDREAMARLSADDQQAVASLRGKQQPLGLMIATAAANFDFARALGLALHDTNPPSGSVTYTVEGVGTSRAVTASSAPAAPQPPVNLTATVTREQVTITATAPPRAAAESTAVTYYLYRAPAAGQGASAQAWTRVSPRPVLPTSPTITLIDEEPPSVETSFLYAVSSRSIFGIESVQSQPASVFVPDFAALDAPRNVTAIATPGSIRVTWEKERNANVAGFLVYRAPNVGGPYTRLTPQPLSAREFVDSSVRAGTSNYYQVVSVNKRGEEGGPSLPSVTLALGAKAPAAPADLAAERKTGRIILRWGAVDSPDLQGYRVERDAGEGEWTIITPTPSTEPRFDDRLPVGVIGVMKYRVSAIALDGQVSPPSQVVSVTLPRAHAPATPEITSITGIDGRVKVEWRPTGERGEATHFLVLRSTAKNDEGVIVTPAPIAFPVVTFTDTTVTAGTRYYYRVVAYDAAANRSLASEPAAVHVGAPPLPALAAPALRFETKPYPRVVASFKLPPNFEGRIVLERRDRSAKWVVITAPSAEGATQLIDTRPPVGERTAYRVTTVGANGVTGAASPAAEIDVK